MGITKNKLSKIRDTLFPKTWNTWELEPAQSQKQSDYLTITSISSQHGLERDINNILDSSQLDKIIEDGTSRKNKYKQFKSLNDIFSVVFIILVIATFAIFVFSIVSSILSLAALKLPFSLIIISILISKYTSTRMKKLSLARIERPITEYCKRAFKKEASLLHEINKQIKQSGMGLYVRDTEGIFWRVKNDYWSLDYWELGLLTTPNARNAIPLLGDAPGGKFYILEDDYFNSNMYKNQQLKLEAEEEARLKEEMRALEEARLKAEAIAKEKALAKKIAAEKSEKAAEKLSVINPARRKTPNSRHNELQLDAVGNIKNIKKLVNMILRAHPKKINGKRKGFNPSKKARLQGLQYIIKNPKFWMEIRTGDADIDDTKNDGHKAELMKIFNEAKRIPSSTLKVNEENLMYDFIDLKNRSFEKWIKKLGWPSD